MTITSLLLYLVIFVVTYLFASIPWGYLAGRFNRIDIRQHGSGNIGATNVLRVLGKKWGIACFILDFLKGLLPVLIVSSLQKHHVISDAANLAVVIAAFAAVAGHVWTIYLKFKGGKGVATIAGAMLAMAPVSVMASVIVWIIFFHSSRYVSLASILAAVTLPVSACIFNLVSITNLSVPAITLLFVLGGLAIYRHRDNIKRLCNGTENRFVKKKDKLATLKKEQPNHESSSSQ